MKKKRVLLVVLALSLIGVFGTAFAASAGTSDPGYMWYNGDHYLQCFEFKNLYGTGWRTTDGITEVYYRGPTKTHANRDFVSQVKQTNLTAYSSAYRGIIYGSGTVITNVAWIRGVAANNAAYTWNPTASKTAMALSARTDDRAVGYYRNFGVWSPDTY